MLFLGLRKCPNCGLPVSPDAVVCHYCRVTVRRCNIWNCGSWIIGGAILFMLASTFGSDNLFGTRFTETLQSLIHGGGS